MFDHALLDSAPARKALSLGYILEAALVGALLLMPLIYTEALPKVVFESVIPMPPPPAASAPAPAARVRREHHHVTAEEILNSRMVIPRTIRQIVETPEPPEVTSAINSIGVPGGVRNGVPNGILHSLWSERNPPPPPALPAAAQPRHRAPLQVGGVVQAAKLIFGPKPEYPPLARMARVQGTVRLQAVISAGGTIQHLTLISGHPLLIDAAMAAVARWRYQPTLLNGEAVEVVTDIEVKFILGD
jgi:protein TonB